MRGPEPTAYLRFPDSELPHDLQRAPLLFFIVLRIELARSVPFFLSFFLSFLFHWVFMGLLTRPSCMCGREVSTTFWYYTGFRIYGPRLNQTEIDHKAKTAIFLKKSYG